MRVKPQKKGIIPFSNGTDFMCWSEANCCQCRKTVEDLDEQGFSKCEIEYAIALSSMGEGMTPEMAMRMGGVESEQYPGSWDFFQNPCSEILPVGAEVKS